MDADFPVPRQPSDWLWQELQSLRSLVTDQHARLRSDMQISFTDLHNELRLDRVYDDETRRRVDQIMVERAMEEKQVLKRSTWLTTVISGGWVFAAELAKWLFRTGTK